MHITKGFALSLSLVILTSCGEDEKERFDTGYNEGYAAGYNTTCELGATLIEGAWDDEEYERGYNAGYADGSADCLADRHRKE